MSEPETLSAEERIAEFRAMHEDDDIGCEVCNDDVTCIHGVLLTALARAEEERDRARAASQQLLDELMGLIRACPCDASRYGEPSPCHCACHALDSLLLSKTPEAQALVAERAALAGHDRDGEEG